MHLAADRESAAAVSIPRDTMVPIPECTRDDGTVVPAQEVQMFNEAFSAGGPACTIKTVEALTKVRIDNYIVVDFTGFKDMVDALGGVKVCLPYAVNDPQSHLDLEAGTQTVRGQQALAYVRTRHGLGDGSDLSRIDRQQAFVGSMVSKVKDKGLLLRPDRLYNFLAAATKSLTTDFGAVSRTWPGSRRTSAACPPRTSRSSRRPTSRRSRTRTASSSSRQPSPSGARCASTGHCPARSPSRARRRPPAPHRAGRRWSPRPRTSA